MSDKPADRHAAEKLIYGFHPVLARLRQDPAGIFEIYLDLTRRDARARDLVHQAKDNGVKLAQVEADRLTRLVGKTARHQGVVARVKPVALTHSLDEVLENIQGPPLLVILDGVTDPHNLGAILRSADAFGVHAVIAPKDNAVGLNATVEKVASGAAETVPYLMVTNLARTIEDLKEHNIWVIAADMDGAQPLSGIDCKTGIAWVLGAEGTGIRRLVKQLRPGRAHPDRRHGGKPQRVGVGGAVPVRDGAAARRLSQRTCPATPSGYILCEAIRGQFAPFPHEQKMVYVE